MSFKSFQFLVSVVAVFVLTACGGGGEPVSSLQVTTPIPMRSALKVPGDKGVALGMYQALYGKAPSYAKLADYTTQASTNQSAFLKSITSNFDNLSGSALAKVVLDNLTITASTVRNTAPSGGPTSYAILLDAIGQLLDAYGKDARGQIILNICNLLANLESDATYGIAAGAFNKQIDANNTYSTNPGNVNDFAVSTNVVLSVSGTAAVGLAVSAANVSAKCSAGNGTAITNSDGTYSLEILGGALPCLIEVSKASESVALRTIASGTGLVAVANATPLTELVTARVFRNNPGTAFANFSSSQAGILTTEAIKSAQSDVATVLTSFIDTSTLVDFISSPLVAATTGNPTGGNAQDKLLDSISGKIAPSQLNQISASLGSTTPLAEVTKTVATVAAVGQPTFTQTGYGVSSFTDASKALFTQCRFTIDIPIRGTNPITFTGWSGKWSNGYSESGTSSFVANPTTSTSLLWVNDLVFRAGDSIAPKPFTILYTVTYRVQATGLESSVSTLLKCEPNVDTSLAVGQPIASQSGYGVSSFTDGSKALFTQCKFTIDIPIRGTNPITFTGWNGKWSNGYSESGTSSFVVDPTKSSSLRWVDGLEFRAGDSTAPKPFTVVYTVKYRIPATGAEGNVSTVLRCGPTLDTSQSVGQPTFTQTGYGVSSFTDGSKALFTQCRFTIDIPIRGTNPITFTGWNGKWSNGYSESGVTSFVADPTRASSLRWVNGLPFNAGDSTAPKPFTVLYTVTYKVLATGEEGSASTILTCAP